ncbi:MAG: glycosyltransferase family 39 protein [Cyanobacteria bacterium J06635_10]
MNKTLKQRWQLPPIWLRILIISLLILGVFFRFANLEKRAYWHDETYTLLRTSGYTVPEVTQQVFNGDVIGVEELRQYQSVNSDKNLFGTINGLVKEDQHHPPIYFVITRFWNQWFGDSVTINRILPVLISLLALPFIYWLCLELFESPLTAWIAVGLTAISPFQIHYAQEIREYSLWGVTTLLMSVSLLRAMRLDTKSSWIIYAVTTIVGLYSAVFSVFVMFGHGIYVAFTEGFRLSRKFITYLLTSFIAVVAFLPWILVILTHLDKIKEVTAWMDTSLPVKDLVKRWILNLQSVFFETNFWLPGSLKTAIAIVMTLLIGYSIYVLWRQTPKKVWLFVVTLIVPISLSLGLADLISGGIRSTNARYFVPTYLGSQVAVAYLLSIGFTSTKIKFGLQRKLRILAVSLMVVGVLSGAIKSVNPRILEEQQMAKIINQADMPLVVSGELSYNGGGTFGDIMVMSHLLDPKVKLQLIIDPNVPEIPTEFKDVFLYKTPESVKRELEKKYKLKPAYKNKLLYLERSV